MAVRTSLNVSLTPELQEFVQARVAGGHYQTASEVIREGLRLLEMQERARDEAFNSLRQKLRRGAKQAERSELVDGERFIDNLVKRVQRRSGRKKPGRA